MPAVKKILQELEALKPEEFEWASSDVVDRWEASERGRETVEPVIRFMEAHPEIEFGVPGALTHWIEKFYDRRYEGLVVASVTRRPTGHTIWLLNRMINGTKDVKRRRKLIEVLAATSTRPELEQYEREHVQELLSFQAERSVATTKRRVRSSQNAKPRRRR